MAKPKMSTADLLDDLKTSLNTLLKVHRDDPESGLFEFFRDPDTDHAPEEIARMGNVFDALGKRLTEAAKGAIMPSLDKTGRVLAAGDIEFKYRAAYTQVRFNTKMAKDVLSQDKHPDYYTATGVKESVQVTVYPRQRPEASEE